MSLFRNAVILLLLLLVAFPLGARLQGETEVRTSIGTLGIEARPDFPGGGEIYVPVADWGLRFQLFHSPILLRAEPRALDRDGALAAATGNETVLRATEREIQSGARWAIVKTLLLSLLLLLAASWVLARLLPSLPRRFPLLALLSGTALSLLIFGLAILTFNPSSLQSPSFYARGSELDQIMKSIDRESAGERGSYEDNFRSILSRVSALLSDSPLPRAEGGRPFVLASDLHTNTLALPALEQFAEGKTIFMPGDFGWEGRDEEAALLAPEIASLGERVVAVSGNHDSSLLMSTLAREGVIVLGSEGILQPEGVWQDRAWQEGNLAVRGWSDPSEWSGEPGDPDRVYDLSPSGMREAERALWSWWQDLASKPDVLLLHQPLLAEYLAERLREYPRPLLILTGHDHTQWVARKGNVSIVDAGSVGAGGIFASGGEKAEMAEIYLSSSRRLETVDMIEVDPFSGGGAARRIDADSVCELPCRYRVPSR